MDRQLPRFMGHRGAAGAAPENTLASIRKAAELGAPWVEFDVMLTRDRVPVLFHDDSLKRVTGRDALMAESPYAAIASLDAGGWFAPEFAGEPIPTLDAALAVTRELALHPNIEIKSTPGRDVETAEAVIEVATRCWRDPGSTPYVSSFSRMSLATAKALRPDWPRGLIAHKIPPDWPVALQALDCTAFHVNHENFEWQDVAMVKSAGYQMAAFTVNLEARARELLDCGLDCLITDRPDRISRAVDPRPATPPSISGAVDPGR